MDLTPYLLKKTSAFQLSIASTTYEEGVDQLTSFKQQEVDQLFLLLSHFFEDLALTRVEELSGSFQSFLPLAARILDLDQLQIL